jgi:hypothetical protein
MYTGFYQVNTDFIKFLQGGPEQQELARKETNFFTVLEGKLVAKVMALTRQPDDQMNVWFGFLQGNGLLAPLGNFFKELRDKTEDRIDFYSILKSTDLVSTKTLSEAEADQYENDPDRVDLVLRFKDISSIYGLLQSQSLNMVDLMFTNLLQIYGNQNHMYKLGAITRNLQLALHF